MATPKKKVKLKATYNNVVLIDKKPLILGHMYKDFVLGVQGLATSSHRNITGCDRVTLSFNVDDVLHALEIDTTRLEYVGPPARGSTVVHKPIDLTRLVLGASYRDMIADKAGALTVITQRVGSKSLFLTCEYVSDKGSVKTLFGEEAHFELVDVGTAQRLKSVPPKEAKAIRAKLIGRIKKDKPGASGQPSMITSGVRSAHTCGVFGVK